VANLSFELMLPDLIPYSIVCLHLIRFSTNDFYIGTYLGSLEIFIKKKIGQSVYVYLFCNDLTNVALCLLITHDYYSYIILYLVSYYSLFIR
jgi:hypothetical protein